MVYLRLLIIVVLANQAAFVVALAGERATPGEPAAVIRHKHSGHYTTQAAGITVKPLDRIATAVDGAESSHGQDIGMWRQDLSGPQGPMQVSAMAAIDVGGGDRFDLTQNRAIGRAYLAHLYGRYKNWPDAVAAYNWGLSNVDSWIKAGRPAEKLLAGVAAYTMRVLHDSGLCSDTETIQPWRSAISAGAPEFRAAIFDSSTYAKFAQFDADDRFTGDNRYLCSTALGGLPKAGSLRLKQGIARSRSLFDQITVSAHSSWLMATRRLDCNGGSRDPFRCQ
jgi:hypothetical protein